MLSRQRDFKIKSRTSLHGLKMSRYITTFTALLFELSQLPLSGSYMKVVNIGKFTAIVYWTNLPVWNMQYLS